MFQQWQLHRYEATFALLAMHWRSVANDHKPLNFASLPEFLLRGLIGMRDAIRGFPTLAVLGRVATR